MHLFLRYLFELVLNHSIRTEVVVVMVSVYKVDANKATNLLMFVANKVFKQKWTVREEKKTKDGGDGGDEYE